MSDIQYPYLPEGKKLLFVDLNNKFIQEAKKACEQLTGCSWWPTGAVVVKDEQVIGKGANSGNLIPLCPRVKHNCPTGQGYEHCADDCHQNGHSEITSINNTLENNNQTKGADLYLFGHWWCCEPCWNHIIKNKINNVYLLKNAPLIFNREVRLDLQNKIAEKINNGLEINRQDIFWQI